MTEHRAGPRLPPGQAQTAKWPVLHYGGIPRIDLGTWEFSVTGEVVEPRRWTWEEFTRLPRTTVRCDIHCVTAWSRFDNTFEGIRASDVLQQVRIRPGAMFVMVESYVAMPPTSRSRRCWRPRCCLRSPTTAGR